MADDLHEHAAPPAGADLVRMRLPALDWMRGFVMVLMAIDHASGAFNHGRVFSDSARMYKAGTVLPADQFFTRFITHLCAPTFVFLAGTAVALSLTQRLRAGASPRSVDAYLLQRGLIILLCDPTWMTLGFTRFEFVLLQVLYAIGASFIAMAGLRRLSLGWMTALGLLLCFGSEALIGLAFALLGDGAPPVWLALLLTGGQYPGLVVAYPLLPWLAIMLLGWAFGRWLLSGGGGMAPALRGGAMSSARRPERLLLGAGCAALAVFALVRGANAYGNMLLPRDDGSWVQWLHVSKYPPGLSYYTLELGVMALLLAGGFTLARRGVRGPLLHALGVLGQTAFFFYLLHAHLLEAAAHLLGWETKLGLASAYIGGLAIVFALYPVCVLYLRYKRTHPDGWTRYL